MEQPLHRYLGMTDDEFDLTVKLLGRKPNNTELAMFSVMWSEHCSYKSSRIHLRRLPSKGPKVLMGPGENAGVVAVDDKIAVALRMESHNHPSAIEPFQGAATGVGGILRDIFTVGARPVALLDSLWMGKQKDPNSQWIFEGVVSGISHYGNAVGVPTVGGEIHFEIPYGSNPLVNVVAVGIAKQSDLIRAQASGVGNHVVLIGAETGRDGIGGVSVLASSGFDDSSSEKRPSVQVGDPFEEKKLIEACLELTSRHLIAGIQDLGGAGLTCATSETAANAGTGMEIWLDQVKLREPDMTPMEILCSESQERMLVIVEPDQLEAVISVCRRHEVEPQVIGRVTEPDRDGPYRGKGVLRVYSTAGGNLVAEIPAPALTDDAPLLDRPRKEPENRNTAPKTFNLSGEWKAVAQEVLAQLSFDASTIYRRYDHMLFRNSLLKPGADAALLRIHAPDLPDTDLAMALSVDGNQRWSQADPRWGTAAVVAESFANLACVGADPVAIVDCLNFGNPEHPEVMWQLSEAIDGIALVSSALGVPVIGGNVSLYNEANGIDIDPTPVVASLGFRSLPKIAVPTFSPKGYLMLLSTGERVGLDGSVAAGVLGIYGNSFPSFDMNALKRILTLVAQMVRDHIILGAHNLGAGGLLQGVKVVLKRAKTHILEAAEMTPEELLGEHPARFLIQTTSPEDVLERSEKASLVCQAIASLGPEKPEVTDLPEWAQLVELDS